MDTLRQETLQSQQTRSDLLKAKLAFVGVIGSVGLGLAGSQVSAHADLVLCAVPLVCVYVDLLCRHLSLRILVIGAFTAAHPPKGEERETLKAYEQFVEHRRKAQGGKVDPFALEDWAVSYSTLTLSLAVVGYGVAVLIEAPSENWPATAAFVLSGSVGVVVTRLGQCAYTHRREEVKRSQAHGPSCGP
jgi:hypothetical protein